MLETGDEAMNNHEDIQKLLSAYCGGDLSETEQARVEEHLVSCTVCRADLTDLKTALQLIRSTPEVEPPPWLTSHVMARIREEKKEQRNWHCHMLTRVF